jgi:hypothetical protein
MAVKPCCPCRAQEKRTFLSTSNVIISQSVTPSSLGQDPTVESAKEKIKNIHLGFFSKKWQFWGVF